jgi:Uma2 family endonuclease
MDDRAGHVVAILGQGGRGVKGDNIRPLRYNLDMDSTAEKHRYTIAEYLRRERESLDKHEYRNGQIIAMAGGSREHSLISANVIGELRNRLKGKPCQVYDSNLRVRIPHTVLYTYPDAAVICGQAEPDPADPSGESTLNPRLIVEVLSPSTEAYDRGEKFGMYLQIDSLEEYVLVSQATPRIETFYRQESGAWLFRWFSGLEATARLRCVDVGLPLAEIYAGIRFPSSPDTPAAISPAR